MMTLPQRLASVSRRATLQDFRVGLHYEEVQPYGNGHQYIPRTINGGTFLGDARDFLYLINHGLAIVPSEIVEGEDYKNAAAQIMSDPSIRELLKDYQDK